MLAKWPFVTPIPGSRKIERIDEKISVLPDVDLTADELARIEGELSQVSIHQEPHLTRTLLSVRPGTFRVHLVGYRSGLEPA